MNLETKKPGTILKGNAVSLAIVIPSWLPGFKI